MNQCEHHYLRVAVVLGIYTRKKVEFTEVQVRAYFPIEFPPFILEIIKIPGHVHEIEKESAPYPELRK